MINPVNHWGVGMTTVPGGEKQVMLIAPPGSKMTADRAMLLAAWLVTMAEVCDPELKFDDFLKAVRT